MSFSHQWYQENRIVEIVFDGDVTTDGIASYNDVMTSYMEQGSAPVHVIIETSNIGAINIHPRELLQATAYLKHPNMGWVVLVGANGFVNFFMSVINTTTPMRFTKAKSKEAAYRILKDKDTSLVAQS